MAKYYVWSEEHYATFEPAEGGYYIDCGRVDEVHLETESYAEAVKEFIQQILCFHKRNEFNCCSVEREWLGDWTEEGNYKFVDVPCPELFCGFNYEDGAGSGYDIRLTKEEPKDRPYEGYC